MIGREALEGLNREFARARCPEDVFGGLPGADAAARRVALRGVYARLSVACHPDVAEPDLRLLAESTFGRLADWKRDAERKLARGDYGDRRPADALPPVTLDIRGRCLVLGDALGPGLFTTVRAARFEDGGRAGTELAMFVKIVRNAADSDMIAREQSSLRRIWTPGDAGEAFFQRQRPYVPSVVDAFSVAAADGTPRRASLLAVPHGRCLTAEALRQTAFPDGLDPRHVWWIFRRLLLTLWMAHLHRIVHGAPTPDHALVYPEQHGIVLLGWTCSAALGDEPVPAADPTWGAFLPPELAQRAPASPAGDIFTAAATALYLLGGDPAAPGAGTDPCGMATRSEGTLVATLRKCLAHDPRRRPQDAETLHNDFGAQLDAVYVRRTYVPLVVPSERNHCHP